MRRTLHLLTLPVLLFACGETPPETEVAPAGYDQALYEHAEQLARSNIIVDGHIDVPWRLTEKMEDISKAAPGGEFDYPRARQGGLDAPFMSIYVPAAFQQTPGASKSMAEKLIAMMDSIIAVNPDKFAHARTPDDVRANFDKGLISLPYGIENGSALEDDLANVKYFYDKGVRYITLTHAKKNLICDSSYDLENQDWNGLSPFGRDVVREMNRVGIMIDISHVTDSTFYQVCRLSATPVICSHSSLRHFTPGWERNVSDDMLKALAQNGGVIQINFGSDFISGKANRHGKERRDHRMSFMQAHNIENRDNPRVQTEMREYRQENPYPYATIEQVVDHIDRAVELVGIDHVGLGSDFDGVGDSLPIGLKSVADYPNLVFHMLERGYSEEDIEKVLSGNVLRVWQQVLDYADTQASN